MEEAPIKRVQLIYLAVAFEGGMGVLACLLGWLLGFPPWHYLHWHTQDLLWSVAVTAPLLVFFHVAHRWPVGPLRGIKDLMEQVIAPLFRQCSVLELAFISLLAGVGEEMLFRGFLQPMLSYWLGAWAGLILASLVFGLVHPFSMTYVVIASLAGFYFGATLWLTDNLLVAILAHAVYDFWALLVLVRTEVKV